MGWNGSDLASTSRAASKRGSSRTPSPHSNGVRNGLIALVLIALAGAAAWWFLSTPMSQPTPVPEEEETPAAPVKRDITRDDDTPVGEKKALTQIVPTADNSEISTSEEAPVEVEETEKKNSPQFHPGAASDQLLMMAARLAEGKAVPPMPISPTASHDFKRSLEHEIVINEEDSDEVKRMKETLIQFRNEMLELTKDGRSVADVLKEHENLMNDNIKIRADIVKEVRELREEGKEKEAEEYLFTMNTAIQQMGIKEVEMPLTEAEREAEDEAEEEYENENQ